MDWKAILGAVLILGAVMYLLSKKGGSCCGTKSEKDESGKKDDSKGCCGHNH
ncbi:MAG: hypothetical protein WC676_05220 [Candidatus Omnitrophota bacterium]